MIKNTKKHKFYVFYYKISFWEIVFFSKKIRCFYWGATWELKF